MINKINIYFFIQIFKSCSLIFFVFVSIAWLLQLTRLLTVTNLIQIDIFSIIYLSIFIIPNLLSIIVPFILIFGILLCFIKLNRDKEIIAIFSLGLQLKPIKISLLFFSLAIIIFYSLLIFYISPKIYEQYKIKEYDLRNTIDFNKIINSNFLKLNKNTTVDFKKNNNSFEDIFIRFIDKEENIIFAKKGFIKNEDKKYIFQLNNGFKLSINNQNKEIEKLEFTNYVLGIENENINDFNNYDRNSFTIIDDIFNRDYLNISFKFFDLIFSVLIIFLFYHNNILNNNFTLKNNLIYILFSLFILITNQLIKNSEINFLSYILISNLLITSGIFFILFKNRYEKS